MNGLGLAGMELHGMMGYNVIAPYRITFDFNTAGTAESGNRLGTLRAGWP
jgi:hypothetical protein